MTLDLENSGVMLWKEPALVELVRLSGLGFTSGLCSGLLLIMDLMSEVKEKEWLGSLAFRRRKQMKTRSRNVLPPMANTMAVTMLMMDFKFFLGADVGDGEEGLGAQGVMSVAIPHRPLLLLYLKPCCRPNNPGMAENKLDLQCMAYIATPKGISWEIAKWEKSKETNVGRKVKKFKHLDFMQKQYLLHSHRLIIYSLLHIQFPSFSQSLRKTRALK